MAYFNKMNPGGIIEDFCSPSLNFRFFSPTEI